MRYLNMPCSFCGKLFAEEDDVVTCPTCASPHHRECWFEKGDCANADRHAEGFVWTAPQSAVKNETPVAKVAAQQQSNQPETVECPFCDARNYANELYCTVCHEPIHQNASADAGEPLQDEEQREKMYADYRTYGGLDPQSNVGDISIKEYSAYVGEKSGNYIRRFMTMHVRDRIVSWNWAAFWSSAVSMIIAVAFGPVWFFYRKMNKWGALYLGILFALSAANLAVYLSDPAFIAFLDRIGDLFGSVMQLTQQAGADATQIANDLAANMQAAMEAYALNSSKLTTVWANVEDVFYSVLFPVVSASFATGLYFRKAKSDIHAVRNQYGNSPDYMQRLQNKGGVSVAGAVVSAIACVLISVAELYLPFVLHQAGII